MNVGSHGPQRVVSLQPSATVVLDRLGLLDRVIACTKWCVEVCPQLVASPRTVVADSWTARADEILAQRPDLVIASVPYQLQAVAQILKAGIRFLGLAPKSLHDIYVDIAIIAGTMGVPERGEAIIEMMKREISKTALQAQTQLGTGTPRPKVYCEEWGKPLIHSQPWVAELVEATGGVFLGVPGEQTNRDEIRSWDPDVIVTAWCGAGDRVPLERIIAQRNWENLAAVRNRRVYCIADHYLNTPAPTLLSGLQALASAILPQVFGEVASGLQRIKQIAPQTSERVTA